MSEEQFEKEGTWYCIENMGAYEIYDVLCKKCSFEKMIILYKLIKHKMEYLDDEVRNYLNEERKSNENSRY